VNEIQKTSDHQQVAAALAAAVIKGDLAQLSPEQQLHYYHEVCKSVGLNPLTKPFEYLKLNGRTVLYATRGATDQLRFVHKVSITLPEKKLEGDVYVVTARAKDATGREDESTGAVNVAGLRGEALANAFLKAETKAKRRVTLSLCGLGVLDESEVDSIPGAEKAAPPTEAATTEKKAAEPEVLPPKETAKPAAAKPTAKGPAPTNAEVVEIDTRKVTENQLKRLWAMQKTSGMPDSEARKLMAAMGVASSKDLNRTQYEEVCREVETWKPEPEMEIERF
jgi:hypothetical protein